MTFTIVSDGEEAILDHFMKNEDIKSLPIVGSVFSLVKISLDIGDRIFIEKMRSFIRNIDRNQTWKEKFNDEEKCKKISKKLLYIIDSCDDDKKLELIGLTFNYLVIGRISEDKFFYIVNIICKSFYPYLKMLSAINESYGRFSNDGTKYDHVGIAHLLYIGALDYAGQSVAVYDSQTQKMEAPPTMIVALNEYENFIKELLNKVE